MLGRAKPNGKDEAAPPSRVLLAKNHRSQRAEQQHREEMRGGADGRGSTFPPTRGLSAGMLRRVQAATRARERAEALAAGELTEEEVARLEEEDLEGGGSEEEGTLYDGYGMYKAPFPKKGVKRARARRSTSVSAGDEEEEEEAATPSTVRRRHVRVKTPRAAKRCWYWVPLVGGPHVQLDILHENVVNDIADRDKWHVAPSSLVHAMAKRLGSRYVRCRKPGKQDLAERPGGVWHLHPAEFDQQTYTLAIVDTSSSEQVTLSLVLREGTGASTTCTDVMSWLAFAQFLTSGSVPARFMKSTTITTRAREAWTRATALNEARKRAIESELEHAEAQPLQGVRRDRRVARVRRRGVVEDEEEGDADPLAREDDYAPLGRNTRRTHPNGGYTLVREGDPALAKAYDDGALARGASVAPNGFPMPASALTAAHTRAEFDFPGYSDALLVASGQPPSPVRAPDSPAEDAPLTVCATSTPARLEVPTTL